MKILPAPKGPGIDYNLLQWTVHSTDHYNTKFPKNVLHIKRDPFNRNVNYSGRVSTIGNTQAEIETH